MNIEELTIGQIREIARMGIGGDSSRSVLIGKYVIVRCRDAGVHAGVLKWTDGRACGLDESRRLWYWKPASGAAFLCGVATAGLDPASKVGAPVYRELTEDCEIILCSKGSEDSIRSTLNYEP